MASVANFDVWQNTAGSTQETVLQVKTYNYGSPWSTTTHGGTGTGPATAGTVTPLSVSITPTLSTSRIFVFASGTPSYYGGIHAWLASLQRSGAGVTTAYSPASTQSSLAGWSTSAYTNTDITMQNFYLSWVDTPATTNTLTYALKITGNNNNASGVGITYANIGTWTIWGGTNTITVMEIAG